MIDKIQFQWDLSSFDEIMEENGHLFEYTSSRGRDYEKERVCERISNGYHDYYPLLMTTFSGWEFRCRTCNKLNSDWNIKFQSEMHEGHSTKEWVKKSFSGICYEYLDWEFGDCGGSIEQIITIRYCSHCRVIYYSGSDDICSKCRAYDFTHMDDYQFFEFEIWIKEYVFEKLRDAGLK